MPVPSGPALALPAAGTFGLLLSCTLLCMKTQHECVWVIGLIPLFGHAPFCGRGRVAGDLRVGVEAVLVVVELRVLDHDRAAGVGARVAERAVFHPGVVDRDVAHLEAGTHVHAGVVEVARVDVGPLGGALRVRREDAVLRGRVLGAEERRGRGEVAARVPVQADLPEPAPPFHQISLPDDLAPARKLHTVRLSMLTPLAFHTRMPLRPSGLPSAPVRP